MTDTETLQAARDVLVEFGGTRDDGRDVGRDVVGFVYSPVAAPWFRLDGGTLRGHGNTVIEPGEVFELRAFDGVRELRWWNVTGGRGRYFVLDSRTLPNGWRAGERYQRLLWGSVRRSDPEWTELFTARVGSLHLPVGGAVTAGSTIRLETQEYMAEDEHGNVSVVDEQLIGFTVMEPVKGTT